MRSGLTIPLRSRGERLGRLSAWRATEAYSPAEQALLQEIAERAALAIAAARQHEDLALDRRRLHAVIQQMPSCFAIVEAPSGRPLLANDRSQAIWRRRPPVVTGIADYAAYQGRHPDGRPIQPEEWPISRSIRTGEVVHRPGDADPPRRRHRRHHPHDSAPVRNERDEIVAGVVTYEDVTETRQAVPALEHQRTLFHCLAQPGARGRQLSARPRLVFEFAHPLTVASLGSRGHG